MLTLVLLSVVGLITLSSLTHSLEPSFQALPKAPTLDLAPSFPTSQAFFTPPSTLSSTLVYPPLPFLPTVARSQTTPTSTTINVCCLIRQHPARHTTPVPGTHHATSDLTLSPSAHTRTQHELNTTTITGQGPIAVSRMVRAIGMQHPHFLPRGLL